MTGSLRLTLAVELRTILRDYDEVRELVNLGAYTRGANTAFDRALELGQSVLDFIKQAPDDHVSFEDSIQELQQVLHPQRAAAPRQPPKQPHTSAKAYKNNL